MKKSDRARGKENNSAEKNEGPVNVLAYCIHLRCNSYRNADRLLLCQRAAVYGSVGRKRRRFIFIACDTRGVKAITCYLSLS